MNLRKSVAVSFALLLALTTLPGCKKKQSAPLADETAPPPASSPAPTAVLRATPTVISAGDQVQLSWRTMDATAVSIDGLGNLPTAGVKTVTPNQSTTYHLTATGPGGTVEATADVTVNGKPAVEVPTSSMSAEEEFKSQVQDIFFDYDTYDIRGDAQATLAKDADFLNRNSSIKIVIGGYCDERGSDEYNLALGQNRADAAKNALVTAGVAANRIRVVSFGKEKPFCTESNEQCWQLNRRAGFAIDK